jgi:hypothetical protein
MLQGQERAKKEQATDNTLGTSVRVGNSEQDNEIINQREDFRQARQFEQAAEFWHLRGDGLRD